MPFLTINGLTVDVDLSTGLDRSYTDLQSFNRSEGMTFEGCHYRELREWSFVIPAQKTDQETHSQRGWIKGRGHHWNFERTDGSTTRFNLYSNEGGPGFDTTMTAGTSKFGTWGGLVASGAAAAATATFGNEGPFSMSVWKLTGVSWALMSYVADGATARFYANSAVTTTFAWAAIGSASGYFSVSLQGENQGGTATVAYYDGFMMLPYALTTNQIAARAARTVAEPSFPFVEADGDFLEDLQPLTVKGFVDSESMEQVTDGTVKNVRYPRVKLVEK